MMIDVVAFEDSAAPGEAVTVQCMEPDCGEVMSLEEAEQHVHTEHGADTMHLWSSLAEYTFSRATVCDPLQGGDPDL